jgi:hypothetical protein
MLDALLDFLARVRFAAPAVDLGPARNSGAHPVTRKIAINNLFIERIGCLRLGGMGARANE